MSDTNSVLPSDSELAALARAGETDAFGELWQRHAAAGTAAARQFGSIADPDDIVSEAYLRILRSLQRGGGPHEAFRPYLYRTIRNIAMDWRTGQPAVPLDDAPELESAERDPEITVLENVVTARAFRQIPERWQAVLWYLDVEGMAPAEAAPLLGLSPNATSALAVRAREGFKKTWLQAHVSDKSVPAECRWTTDRMANYVRGTLTSRSRARFDRHLETCVRCSILVAEIEDLSGHLAGLLLPIMLGGPAAAGIAAQLAQQGGGTAAPTISASAPRRAVLATAAGVLALALVTTGAVAVTTSWNAPTAPASIDVAPPSASPSPSNTDPVDPESTPSPASEPPAPPAPPVPSAPPATPLPPRDTAAPSAPAAALPADGELTNLSQPTFSGTGEPGARVEVHGLNPVTVLLATTVGADGHWSATPSRPLPDGAHELLLSQVDAAGNRSAITTRTITVDTIALAPVIDPLPVSPMYFLPQVTGSAEAGATVTLRDTSGGEIATVTAGSDGRWAIPLPDPLVDDRALTATQKDLAGNSSAASVSSDPLSFYRPSIPSPAADAVLPSTDGSTVVTVELSGQEGYQVQVFIDGAGTGNLHTLEAGPISRVTPPLADGAHTIGVRYFDAATGTPGSMYTIDIVIG